MSIFTLYILLTVIPNLREISGVLAIILSVCLLLGAVFMCAVLDACDSDNEDKYRTTGKRLAKVTAIVVAVCCTLSTFLPSKDQMLLIAGGSIVTNAEGIEELPNKVAEVANNTIDVANHFLKELAETNEHK